MRRMNKDRHIYVVTAVVALMMATAINVLVPRNPLGGTLVVPDASVASQASGGARNVEVSSTGAVAPL
jgi:hypothetical protein